MPFIPKGSGSGSGGIAGAAEWGLITGTLSSQLDVQNALDAKANAVPESVSEVWVDLTNGSDTHVNHSIIEPYLTLQNAILGSTYDTTGAVVYISSGGTIPSYTISPNLGVNGLTIKGQSSANDTIIDGLIIESSTGLLILRNLTLNNLSCKATNVYLDNCILTGSVTLNANNNFFQFKQVDYTQVTDFNLVYNGSNTGVLLVEADCLGNDDLKPNISIFIDSALTTPPVTPILDTAYLINGVGSGAWLGQDNNIAVYNGATWDFKTPVLRQIISDGSLYYRYNGSGWDLIEFDNWLVSTKVSDLISKGLQSTASWLKSFWSRARTIVSDQNVDAGGGISEGGNINASAEYYLTYFQYDVTIYAKFAANRGGQLINVFMPALNDISQNYVGDETIAMEVVMAGEASSDTEMSSFFDKDVFILTNHSSSTDDVVIKLIGTVKNLGNTPLSIREATGGIVDGTTGIVLTPSSTIIIRWSNSRQQFEEQ